MPTLLELLAAQGTSAPAQPRTLLDAVASGEQNPNVLPQRPDTAIGNAANAAMSTVAQQGNDLLTTVAQFDPVNQAQVNILGNPKPDYVGYGSQVRQSLRQSLPYNPDSTSGFVGEAAGNLASAVVPTLAGVPAPLVAGAFGVSAYGGSQIDTAQRRAAGEQITPGQETLAASMHAATQFAGEFLGLHSIQHAADKVVMGTLQKAAMDYMIGAGVNATQAGVQQAMMNAANRYVLEQGRPDSQKTSILEGVGRAASIGGAVGVGGVGMQHAMSGVQAMPGGEQQPAAVPQEQAVPPQAAPEQAPVAPAPQPPQDFIRNTVDDFGGNHGAVLPEGATGEVVSVPGGQGVREPILAQAPARQPEGTPRIQEAAPVVPERVKAETSLATSSPKVRINEGSESRSVALDFSSQVDKALYIESQPRKGKLQKDATAYLESQGYADPQMRESLASELRDKVETLARAAKDRAVVPEFQKPRQAAQEAAGRAPELQPARQPSATADAAESVYKPKYQTADELGRQAAIANERAAAYAASSPAAGKLDRAVQSAMDAHDGGQSSPDLHAAKLPHELAGAKPRYNLGPKAYEPKFESDVDRALFVTSQKNPSKRDAAYRSFLRDQGLTDEHIEAGGQQVRNAIKAQAKGSEPGEISIPRTYRNEADRAYLPADPEERNRRYLAAVERAGRKVSDFRLEHPANAEQAQVQEMFRARGVEVSYFTGESRGFRDKADPGFIFVNRKNVAEGLREAVAHEFVHELHDSRPELYRAIKDTLTPEQRKGFETEYEQAFARMRPGQTPHALHEEGVALPAGRAALDSSVWAKAVGQNRNLLQRVGDAFRRFVSGFTAGGRANNRLKDQMVRAFEETLSSPLRPKPVAEPVDTATHLPNDEVRDQAKDYNEEAGLPAPKPQRYVGVDTERAKRIADWYDQAVSQPSDPKVQASYKAMKEETKAQWDFLEKRGVKFEPWTKEGQPYKNSEAVHADIRDNHHLWFFPTEGGFGQAPIDAQSHPLLEKSGVTVNGRELLYNDLFRAVHDYFGHAKEGVGFGPRGEENAWLSHSQMYSETARPAMTAETRGQNSWVNYGPNGEHNRANPKDTIYAEQKVLAAPHEFTTPDASAFDSESSFLPRDEEKRKEALDKLHTADLREAPLNADHGMFGPQPVRKGSVKVDEVARILDERTRKLAGQAKVRESEKIERAVAAGIPEAQYQLQQPDSGKEWYKQDIAKMERTMEGLHPDLKEPGNMTVFKALLAITSQGNRPDVNMKAADAIYRHWSDTGEMLKKQPGGKNWPSTLGENIELPLTRLEKLIGREGGAEGAAKWLLEKHTVQEVNDFSREIGLNPNVSGPKDEQVYGMEMFGPKIGTFALNQHGIQEKITKDLWFSRTWNRWMGTLLDEGGQPVDAPRNDAEREVMDKAVGILADHLGMDPSEVQAVLWYYEQQLWKAHGAKAESGSYSKAAQALTEGNRYDLERAFAAGKGGVTEEGGATPDRFDFSARDGESGVASGPQPEPDFLPNNPLKRNGKDLPEEVTPLNDTREGRIRGQDTRARFLMRDLTDAVQKDTGRRFQDLTDAEVKALDTQLKGGANAGMGPAVDAALGEMRGHVDRLSKAVIASGVLGPAATKTVGANLGKYLNRSYRVFDDPKWVENIPQPVRDAAKTFIEGQLRRKGQPVSLAEPYLDEMLQDMKDGGVDRWFANGKLGAKNVSILRRRKQIAPEIRAVMGEYTNPLANYAKSVSKTATLVANHLFLEDVKNAGMGKWLFTDDTAPSGYRTQIAAEHSDAMAPLNGLRTSPEIARAFEEFNAAHPQSGWAKAWLKANFIAKSSKTVFSAMTQARNIIGQPFFWAMNGHWDWTQLKKAVQTTVADYKAKGDPAMREYVSELQRLGILGNGVDSGQLLGDMRDAGLLDPDNSAMGKALRLGKVVVDPFQKLYAAADHLGKVVAFENELANVRKVDPSLPLADAKRQAADRVLDTYPTYSRIPQAVQNLRRQPLFGPFMAFWYEAIRTTGNGLRYTYDDLKPGTNAAQKARGARRLAGQLTVAAAPLAAQAISRALLGMSDKDEQGFRKFLPDYSKDNTFVFWGKDKGQVTYTDLSALNPYNNILDAASSFAKGVTTDPKQAMIDGVSSFFRPLVNEGLFTKAIREAKSNTTDTGGRVYQPQDTEAKQWEDITLHLLKAVEPGTIQRARTRIVPSFTSGETSYGDKLFPSQELLSEGGVKTKTLNYDTALMFAGRKYQQEAVDVSNLFLRTLHHGSDPADIVGSFKAMEDRRKEKFDTLHDQAEAAMESGLSKREVYAALTKGGVGQDAAVNIIMGRYEPYDITGSSVTEAYRERKADFPLKDLIAAYRDRRAAAKVK